MRRFNSPVPAIAMFVIAQTTLLAGSIEIPWYTFDGGGATGAGASAGGLYAVGGTVGQPDAGSFVVPMSGGAFELVGGFWAAATPTCACPGDMNHDGDRTGADVQGFVNCFIGAGGCQCADVDGESGVNEDDISQFVADLLAGSPCP